MNSIVYQLYTRRYVDSFICISSFICIVTLLTLYIFQPTYMFTDKEYRGPFAFSEELGNLSIGVEAPETIVSSQIVDANDKDLLLSTSEKEDNKGLSNNGSAYNAPAYDGSLSLTAPQVQSDLLSLDAPLPSHPPHSSLAIDDLLGLGMSVASTPPTPPPPVLKLNAKAVLDPNTFQQKWRQLPVSVSQVSCQTTSIFSIVCLRLLRTMPNFPIPMGIPRFPSIVSLLASCSLVNH